MYQPEQYIAALNVISPDCGRDTWVKILMGAKAAGIAEEEARAWSARGASYTPEAFDSTWRSIDVTGGVGAGTLIHEAKQAGWQPSRPLCPSIEMLQKAGFKIAPPNVTSRPVRRIYEYRDAAGRLTRIKIRFDDDTGPKCTQRYAIVPEADPTRWGDKTQWGASKPEDFADTLYRLPELLAASADAVVYLFEGEHDADTAAALRLLSSCFKDDKVLTGVVFAPLKKRRVVLCGDNDEAGKKYIMGAAARLTKIAEEVKIIGIPDKKDLSDYVEANPDITPDAMRQRLEQWAAEAAPQTFTAEERKAIQSRENGSKHKTTPVDVIAMSFAGTRRKDGVLTLRYYAGSWWEYRNNCWKSMAIGDLESYIMGYLQTVIREEDGDIRISAALLRDVIKNLQSTAICALPTDRYRMPCFIPDGSDARQWLPMQNGILHIGEAVAAVKEGRITADLIHPHTPTAFISYALPYAFNPAAQCPKWLDYLAGVQPEPANREALQMLCGLALTPDTRYNVAFFLFGEAGTGKSVFCEILTALVGSENTCSIPLSRFADRFGMVPITEKLLNVMGELPIMPEGGKMADVEGMFKQVTSGEEIPIEKKFQDGYKARALARCVFATNTMPHFTDRSGGVWDRLRIIPFNQVFRNTEKQNKNLSAELLEELPGIFNWALAGLAKLQALTTFPEVPEGETIKTELRRDCNHEREFLIENICEAKGCWIETKRLYKMYREWTLDNGYRAVGEANFSREVKRIFPKSYKTREAGIAQRAQIFRNINIISKI